MNKFALFTLVALATSAPVFGMEQKRLIDDIKQGKIEVVCTDVYRNGFISINGKGYTDIEGLEKVPGINNIDALFLEQTKLTHIPACITSKNLKTLLLEENNISHIPREIAGMHNLLNLSIYANPLQSVAPEFSQLADLMCLYIDTDQAHLFIPLVAGMTNLKRIIIEKSGNSYAEALQVKDKFTDYYEKPRRFERMYPNLYKGYRVSLKRK